MSTEDKSEEMNEIVVSLSDISKCYKRYPHPMERLKETLFRGKSRGDEFWALRSLDLEIYQGETLGILGRNGSGKSTLLQIIAGTLTPTTGTVEVRGRVSALLELGSGFNPEFTGRQNVFFKGRILGLSQAELERKFDDIVAFADIGDFIEQPVKTYSSGMFVRLAFAVAIHVEPEILIVDEALAVGDIFFQQKCFRALEQLRDSGMSIIFVSHDLQSVTKLCDRAMILQSGHMVGMGSPSAMANRYTEMYYSSARSNVLPLHTFQPSAEHDNLNPLDLDQCPVSHNFVQDFSNLERHGQLQNLIAGICISDLEGHPKSVFHIGEEMLLSVRIGPHPIEICPLNIGFQIKNRLGQICIGTNTCLLNEQLDIEQVGTPFICQFRFRLLIFPTTYTINVAVAEYRINAEIVYDWIENVGIIDVVTSGHPNQIGLCFPDVQVKTI